MLSCGSSGLYCGSLDIFGSLYGIISGEQGVELYICNIFLLKDLTTFGPENRVAVLHWSSLINESSTESILTSYYFGNISKKTTRKWTILP